MPAPLTPPSDLRPPHLLLDHELLTRLGPAAPLELWRSILRRTGLAGLTPSESAAGQQLRRLQEALARWEAAERREAAAFDAWGRAPMELRIALLAGAGLMVPAAVAVGLVPWPWMGVLVVLAAAWWGLQRGPGAGDPEIERRHAARDVAIADATEALRALVSKSFIDVFGESVVENTPHRDYLLLRREELYNLRAAGEARIHELEETIAAVRAANLRIGRPEDDAETYRLRLNQEAEQARCTRIEAVAQHLTLQLERYDRQLEQLRALAERQALSERVGRLVEGSHRDPVAALTASVEVDVLGIEAEIQSLGMERNTSGQRLHALLEVVGALTPGLTRS